MQNEILAPALVLVLWTLVVLFWMAAARGAAARGKLDINNLPAGARGVDLDNVLPASANWKSHNLTHLHEQPTLFYAVIAFAAIAGSAAMTDVWLAWGYVGFRIVHSLWQGLVNTVPVRFTLFLIATICLIALAIRTLIAVI